MKNNDTTNPLEKILEKSDELFSANVGGTGVDGRVFSWKREEHDAATTFSYISDSGFMANDTEGTVQNIWNMKDQ